MSTSINVRRATAGQVAPLPSPVFSTSTETPDQTFGTSTDQLLNTESAQDAASKLSAVPTGEMIICRNDVPDEGFLFTDGTSLGKNQYPELFSKLGYTYGNGGVESVTGGFTVYNNKFYVTGGWLIDGVPTNMFAQYDPSTSSWSSMPMMPITLRDHKAVVYNNKMYLFGGVRRDLTPAAADVEFTDLLIFDFTLNTWSFAGITLAFKRYPTGQVYGNKLYIICGQTGSLASSSTCGNLTEVNLDTYVITERTVCPINKAAVNSCIIGSNIFVLGGSSDAYLYKCDLTTFTWTNVATMPTSFYSPVIVAYNNLIYVYGGSPTGTDNNTIFYQIDTVYDVYGGSGGSTTGTADNNTIFYQIDTANSYAITTKTSGGLNSYLCYYGLINDELYVYAGRTDLPIIATYKSLYKVNLTSFTWTQLGDNDAYFNLPNEMSEVSNPVKPVNIQPDAAYSGAVCQSNGAIYYIPSCNTHSTSINDFWKYTISSNSWTKLPSLPVNIVAPLITVYNNIIYVITGFTTRNTADVSSFIYKFDLSTNIWSKVSTTIPGRCNAMGGLYGNKYFITGGYNGSSTYLSDTIELNLDTLTVVTRTSLPTALAKAGYAINGNKLYIVGGMNSSSALVSTVYEFNMDTFTWSIKTPLGFSVNSNRCIINNNKLYTYGGYSTTWINTLWEMDLSTYTWTQKTSNSLAVEWHNTVVNNGILYSIGGTNNSIIYKNFYMCDLTTFTWSQINQAPSNAKSFAYTSTDLYIFGGTTATYDNTLWKFTFSTKKWTQLASGATIRRGGALHYYNGCLYLHAGWNGTTFYNDLWKYTISSNTWTQLTSGGVVNSAALYNEVIVGNTIYSVGGTIDASGAASGGSALVYSYNIDTATWKALASFPMNISNNNVAYYDGKIIVSGGSSYSNDPSTPYTAIYEYNISNKTWTKKGDLLVNLIQASSIVKDNYMYLFNGNILSGGAQVYSYDIYQVDLLTYNIKKLKSKFISSTINGLKNMPVVNNRAYLTCHTTDPTLVFTLDLPQYNQIKY